MASDNQQQIRLGPRLDSAATRSLGLGPGVQKTWSMRSQVSGVVESAKEALEEGLNPTTLMTRAILVGVPAIAMCFLRFACIGTLDLFCENITIQPRTLRGLLLGVPLAPVMHVSSSQLVVDLLGWCGLGFGMTAYGTRFFVLAMIFLTVVSGVPTWLLGNPRVFHTGTSGVLFGIFAFHLSILPFRRPLHWADIVSFCIFDLGFGGIWWFDHYDAHGASLVLSVSGLLAGVSFAWVYFRIFSEDLNVQETLPLIGSSLLYVERATETAVDAAAYTALVAANEKVQRMVAEHEKPAKAKESV
eukprot:gnl/MRDRNA2_/MRDRNA2_117369_c0_seq1.p1 gnl/MRDRNA2_/MRDRNA2_117369_c0~~gnl/MRDRNA2_/MRDRNA2_117369_c0_seq1.p1  ORF type:complete len:302 (-),score=38.03 gnl/MRDRNA2_/MRDRNA2_117369_c0_seq1:38-943(-)